MRAACVPRTLLPDSPPPFAETLSDYFSSGFGEHGTSSEEGNNGEEMPAEHQTVQVSKHTRARGSNRATRRTGLIDARAITCKRCLISALPD